MHLPSDMWIVVKYVLVHAGNRYIKSLWIVLCSCWYIYRKNTPIYFDFYVINGLHSSPPKKFIVWWSTQYVCLYKSQMLKRRNLQSLFQIQIRMQRGDEHHRKYDPNCCTVASGYRHTCRLFMCLIWIHVVHNISVRSMLHSISVNLHLKLCNSECGNFTRRKFTIWYLNSSWRFQNVSNMLSLLSDASRCSSR